MLTENRERDGMARTLDQPHVALYAVTLAPLYISVSNSNERLRMHCNRSLERQVCLGLSKPQQGCISAQISYQGSERSLQGRFRAQLRTLKRRRVEQTARSKRACRGEGVERSEQRERP